MSDSTVTARNLEEVGGLVGYGVNTYMEGCGFSGSVTGGNRVGGLLGYEEENVEIIGSYNLGTVNGYIRTGGLVGSVEGETTLTGSYNEGKIISTIHDTWGAYQGVGGLVGQLGK